MLGFAPSAMSASPLHHPTAGDTRAGQARNLWRLDEDQRQPNRQPAIEAVSKVVTVGGCRPGPRHRDPEPLLAWPTCPGPSMAWHGALPTSTRVQEHPGLLVSVVGVIAAY